MLEFWLDPDSSYFKANKIKDVKKILILCTWFSSALATKSLVDMGFKNVAHVSGGFDALKKTGLKTVAKEKNKLFTCLFNHKFILSCPQKILLFDTKLEPKTPFS